VRKLRSLNKNSRKKLLLDESGPALNQVIAVDSILLQLLQGENASAVKVSLVDSNNQSYDIAAEDVRPVPNFPFTQVVFRLPDNTAVGACIITLKAHGETSNPGSIRIRT
jgi:hypothetical protein